MSKPIIHGFENIRKRLLALISGRKRNFKDCRLCTEYAGKKKGCTAKTCPWLAERIEAGVVGYKEAVMETFPRKLDDFLFQERGIHITTLRHPHGFEWMMFEEPKQKPSCLERRARLGIPPYGNGWPGIKVRWCTGQLKTHLITKETNRLKKEKNALHHIGIAADEAHRCKDEPHNRYPLVEWGITEAQALQICYDRGYDWGGLYEIYRRASCWCCPFQRIDELRKLRHHHPELWVRLLDMDNRARAMFGPCPLGQFKQNWSVERLEKRFAREDAETTA